MQTHIKPTLRSCQSLLILSFALTFSIQPVPGQTEPVLTKNFQKLYDLPNETRPANQDPAWDACSENFKPRRAIPWNTRQSEIFTKSGKANHNAHDVLTSQNHKIPINIKFSYGFFDKDIEDEPVSLMVADANCNWSTQAQGLTNKDGRLILEMEPLPVGHYPARAILEPDGTMAHFQISVLPSKRDLAIIDIDGTLTLSDGELIHQIFKKLFFGEYVPKMREGAIQTARLLKAKGYHLVYLTGRPYPLHRITRSWLKSKRFPPGTLILTDSKRQSLPFKKAVGQFKAQRIQAMIDGGFDAVIGLGNAKTDIFAYEKADLSKDLTFIIGKHAGKEGTVKITDYPSSLPFFQTLPVAK